MAYRIASWIVGAIFYLTIQAAHAAEALSSSIPPFSIETGAQRGFVRDIAEEMAKRVGVELIVIYSRNWPQSQEEAKQRPNTLIFPLSRNQDREAHYQWLQKVYDFDILFAVAPNKPPVDSDAKTRALARIGVREGAPMEKQLRDRGYSNLTVLKTSIDCATALNEGKIDAWYAPAPEIAFTWLQQTLPGIPEFGLKLDSSPLFIAASRTTPEIDFAKWREAYRSMEQDGTRARILAAYGLK